VKNMAITKKVNETSLGIEIQKGVDKAGDAIYAKRTFSNLRNNVVEQNAYDVAEAIKNVLEANTRSVSITVASELIQA
jgi:hypothetical protein